ncbi:hypothetical protein BO94DRAFT_626620 [Aspergillus sclerotioniger CBS 115572]|uniref:Uncharacterized protein n=1 Tax=Aspergillus sclerotioniger CBS 115572 TaxID=1450535 RepID=A0A317VWQ4_9EURO|nr:hypothetical protein BO94DRAFT_626620 [Aspergillus sclerotioniger CBS 115572]PWY78019.1 hypothetical protein BO94DRAFT_626620 [Aspergillus sclerotioniger CBS 115572]
MEVAFPCYAFDCASACKEVMKTLVYTSTGHIAENNSTNIKQMHTPPRVLQQLNAARGRLRNILHKGLFEKLGEIVAEGSCPFWPLEESLKHKSIDDIIAQLHLFDPTKMRYEEQASKDPDRREPRCCTCGHNWSYVVIVAAARVTKYFDGFCLYYIDSSKNLCEGGDQDDDYRH